MSGQHMKFPKCNSSAGIHALPPTLQTNLVAALLPRYIPQGGHSAQLSLTHTCPQAAFAQMRSQQGELQDSRACLQDFGKRGYCGYRHHHTLLEQATN